MDDLTTAFAILVERPNIGNPKLFMAGEESVASSPAASGE
jgi:hypothetical protein